MISFEEAREDSDEILILGYEGLFTNARVDRETIPEGWFAYDIRGGDEDGFCTLEENVAANHTGTFLTTEHVELPDGYLTIEDDYSFL